MEGFSNVFAVGDATNVKETKLGYLAAAQVWILPAARCARMCSVVLVHEVCILEVQPCHLD